MLTTVFSKSIGFSRAPSFWRLVRHVLSNVVVKSYRALAFAPTAESQAPALIKLVPKNNELTRGKLHTNTRTVQTIRNVVEYCAYMIKWRLQPGHFIWSFSALKRLPANSIFDWEELYFFSFEGTDESDCVLHSAVTKQTVISLSGNLVSSASDITDECYVRLEGVGGGGCHIVYQMQLCNCVMVADDGEMRRIGGVWTREKTLYLTGRKALDQ